MRRDQPYTYTKRQPGNLDAWRIGEACSAASKASAGDHIDRGLVLLRELERKGFAIIPLDPDRNGY